MLERVSQYNFHNSSKTIVLRLTSQISISFRLSFVMFAIRKNTQFGFSSFFPFYACRRKRKG